MDGKADQHPSLDGYEEIHIVVFTLKASRGERLLDPKTLNLKHSTFNLNPYTLKPLTLNPEP